MRTESGEDSTHGLAIFVSIIAAMLIWFMISMRESYSVVRDFPVEFVEMPSDTAFADLPPSTVRVRVEGDGWQLLKLYTTTSAIKVDVSSGPIDLMTEASRNLAPDLIPESVSPTQMTLALEPRTSREIAVGLRSNIRTVPPFDLLRPIRLSPDSIVVSGAASVLDRLTAWPTEVLKLEHVNSSFTTSVRLADTLGGLVSKSITHVGAFGDIAEFTENRRQLQVRVTGAPPGEQRFRLIPNRVAVRYRVPIGQFDASTVADSFYAAVPYTEILADTTGRVSPDVVVPKDLVVKDLTVETPRLQYYVVLD
jgi:hypothetical protein